MFYYIKSNKTIWMFYGKFAVEGDNPLNNANIYNVEGDNMLPPGLQPMLTGRVLKIPFLQSSSVTYCVALCKTKYSSSRHQVVSV